MSYITFDNCDKAGISFTKNTAPQVQNSSFQSIKISDMNKSRYERFRSFNSKYHISRERNGCNYRNRTVRKIPIIKTTVQNLNLEYVKPQRAGIIIYTVINGSIYFGLGLDAKTHDLTDFGGGVIYKTDLNVIRGALREFEEETLEIFDPITFDDIKQCPVIYDNDNLIIFVHMNIDPDTTCVAFNTKYKQIINTNRSLPIRKGRHTDDIGSPVRDTTTGAGRQYHQCKIKDPEVCGITWLTWEEFQRSINEQGIIFARVQRFLARAEDFSYLL